MTTEADFPEVMAAFPIRRASRRGGWDVPCPVLANHPRGDKRWSGRLFFSTDGTHLRYWCGKGCTWHQATAACGVPKTFWHKNKGRGIVDESKRPKEVDAYPYTDAAEEVMYEKVRTEPKGFYYRRPGPGGKGFVYSLEKGFYVWSTNRWVSCQEGMDGAVFLDECRKVPFQWTELRKKPDHPVIVVEGEKAARHLLRIGYPTSICSPDGAGKWPCQFGGYLSGRDVVIFADNDEVGEMHAAQVAGSALLYDCKSLRLVKNGAVDGYRLPEGGDVYDWLLKQSTGANSDLKARAIQYDALKKLVKTLPKIGKIAGT